MSMIAMEASILYSNSQITNDIPHQYHMITIECLRHSTLCSLCHYLDPPMTSTTTSSTSELCKDYRGLCQLFGLDPQKVRYLEDKDERTKKAIRFWLEYSSSKETDCTVGKLRTFLLRIDRYDVITDCSAMIVADAEAWINSSRSTDGNNSTPTSTPEWVLTVHDNAHTGHKQMYACCLCAKEDEPMTSLVQEMFTLISDVKLFCPPDDLILGTYEHAATARVIKERCGGKVVFFISESFGDSQASTFSLHYSKDNDPDARKGLLVPFILSPDHLPDVLRGITGIRWFRKSCRRSSWFKLSQLLTSHLSISIQETVRTRLEAELNDNPRKWKISN